jgi:hypothetical protein
LVFVGRDSLVETYVGYITSPSATGVQLIILGVGGIGKTSLALVLVHDVRVKAKFGQQRFFVPVEAMQTAAELPIALAGLFGLAQTGDVLAGVIEHLENQECTLVVIDNLETMWNDTDIPKKNQIEADIRKLAAIPTLTLIVTTRGGFPISDIAWSNIDDTSIKPLAPNDARLAFATLSRNKVTLPEELRALDVLLKETDGMPLALSLLAQLSTRGHTPSRLLHRWRGLKTELLQTVADDDKSSAGTAARRLLSVSASIRLSIEYLPQNNLSRYNFLPSLRRYLVVCESVRRMP